ncbi:hypothetical protein JG688_00012914 [Phytophthora aleatoria]|uniref:Uncharacterized protein n=1 Tax=Phytophthora aleatoria TaxID=2496075 RepID=A0A8J5IXZ1_9STRA|nr:hypothetical protein JG688_00012914 [Phytophthora aleatoria]
MGSAFEFTAGAGQIVIMERMQLCSEEYAEGVKFLSVKKELTPEQTKKAFTEVALNMVPSFKATRDQTGVLEVLFATRFIPPSFIKSLFKNTARRSNLDVVEFLYAKGAIPPGMVKTGFGFAIRDNGGDVISFLAKTGAVPTKQFESDLSNDIYNSVFFPIACLYSNGEHLRLSCPEIAVIGISENIEEDAVDVYDFQQFKCIKAELFPHIIRPLPHVMKLVELYCMSVDMAILEAAATGQIERLN